MARSSGAQATLITAAETPAPHIRGRCRFSCERCTRRAEGSQRSQWARGSARSCVSDAVSFPLRGRRSGIFTRSDMDTNAGVDTRPRDRLKSDTIVVGMDVGSTTVKAVVVDPSRTALLWADYQRHDTPHAAKTPEVLLELGREF